MSPREVSSLLVRAGERSIVACVVMDGTKIEWTDATWNPIRGCSRVSSGCVNCYAEKVAARFSGPGLPYEGLARKDKRGLAQWTGRIKFIDDVLTQPMRWQKPRKIFVNSMSDLFHEGVTDRAIAAIFGVMALSPRHTFQILTKRPERARKWFEWVENDADGAASHCVHRLHERIGVQGLCPAGAWPLPNVWLGVSVEDQKTADERIPLLLDTPAAVRFVSYEPALGPIDFDEARCDSCGENDERGETEDGRPWCIECEHEMSYRHWLNPLNGGLNWIIVGGESGPGARPFDVAWARATVERCRDAGVACFVKQLGADPFDGSLKLPRSMQRLKLTNRKGGDMSEWPEDLRVRQFPVLR